MAVFLRFKDNQDSVHKCRTAPGALGLKRVIELPTCLLHGVSEVHQSAAVMVTVNCHPQATQDVSLEINNSCI